MLKDCSSPLCLVFPTIVWMTINMALVFIGSYLVTFHAVSLCLHITLSDVTVSSLEYRSLRCLRKIFFFPPLFFPSAASLFVPYSLFPFLPFIFSFRFLPSLLPFSSLYVYSFFGWQAPLQWCGAFSTIPLYLILPSFLARDVIYTSRAYAMMPVRLSLCPSVCDGSALAHYS